MLGRSGDSRMARGAARGWLVGQPARGLGRMHFEVTSRAQGSHKMRCKEQGEGGQVPARTKIGHKSARIGQNRRQFFYVVNQFLFVRNGKSRILAPVSFYKSYGP